MNQGRLLCAPRNSSVLGLSHGHHHSHLWFSWHEPSWNSLTFPTHILFYPHTLPVSQSEAGLSIPMLQKEGQAQHPHVTEGGTGSASWSHRREEKTKPAIL